MPGGAGDAAPWARSVWLLGNTHPNADRSIGWDAAFPNLGDPDVLIVDLTTLTAPVLEKIGRAKLEQARPLIRDKILNRGIVVVITRPLLFTCPFAIPDADAYPIPASHLDDPLVHSNYQILPVWLETREVPTGEAIVADRGHVFREYVDSVREFSFYIADYHPRIVLDTDTGSTNVELLAVDGQGIRDNCGHYLGLTLAAVVVDHYNNEYKPYENAGRLVFLPPPTEPIGCAIEKILSACGKANQHAEAPPAWAEQMPLGPASEYRAQINLLKERKAEIEGVIDGLERQRDAILAHRRLLYMDGPGLEDAVVKAFRALGFDDIAPMGKGDEEDAAFAMGGGTRYSHGVIEAKGSRRGIHLKDILQCNKWTDQWVMAEGMPSKGIFVPNQHRLEPYPESLEIRVKIEPNQLVQAEIKDICIIPSCALFEAVGRVLGGKTPDRAEIAGRIAGTKGVLRDVF